MKYALVIFIWFSSGSGVDIEIKKLGYFEDKKHCVEVATKIKDLQHKGVNMRLPYGVVSITHAICIKDLK